ISLDKPKENYIIQMNVWLSKLFIVLTKKIVIAYFLLRYDKKQGMTSSTHRLVFQDLFHAP
ncbi:MAG: hypothetical protein QGI34_05500, partial [Candidatus Latescibacteria bacterium]|nr:hypothetical protein [Candidatus Latescibacterota bacterium]